MQTAEELVAGPELDLRIAAVMRRQVTGTLYESVGGTGGTGGMRAGIGPYRGLVTAEEGCWSPSTDISAAWQVAEMLADRGVAVRLIYSVLTGEWSAQFGTVACSEESAPLAICKAALQAISR